MKVKSNDTVCIFRRWVSPGCRLFLFCFERDFVVSLSGDKRANVIDVFYTTSRCLDGILGTDGVCFGNVVGRMCSSGLRLGRADASDTEAAFLDLHLSVSNDIVSARVYDGRGDFGFGIVNFPFLDGGVPRSASFGVYISQLVRFAGVSGCVAGFGARGGLLARRLLGQGYRYHKLRNTFSNC